MKWPIHTFSLSVSRISKVFFKAHEFTSGRSTITIKNKIFTNCAFHLVQLILFSLFTLWTFEMRFSFFQIFTGTERYYQSIKLAMTRPLGCAVWRIEMSQNQLTIPFVLKILIHLNTRVNKFGISFR